MNRTGDQALAADLTEIYANQQSRVLRIVTRALRVEDQGQAEDLAQDVWLMVWQYLLRGNTIRHAPGLLSVLARRRVYSYYRLARVRREQVTEPEELALAVERLCALLEGVR
jgi:DNA-directed RNA polymerase specialized sigma24 family protein